MTFKNALFPVLSILALSSATLFGQAADIAFSPSEDGLYAVFSTSEGEFAATLYYEQAPLTVANFVGLAEGSLVRWDTGNKKPITGPFYDGIAFHRVIDDFVIQGGSPNGQGTDGPGYTIPDEIVPTLVHDKTGLLSMAKSGPNSGGSQFFVTLAPTSWLDGIHSIFGEIVAGQSIVDAIGATPTDAADKPLTPVVIEKITILREGAAASGFDPNDYDVPNVLFPKIQLELGSSQAVARFDRKKHADYLLRQSTSLSSWDLEENLLATYQAPDTHQLDLSGSIEAAQKVFLEVTEITYPYAIDAAGTNLTVTLPGNDPIQIQLGENSVGEYTFGDFNSSVTSYRWYPLENRDQLYIEFNGLYNMQIYFTWTNDTQGEAFAHVLASSAFNLSGTVETNGKPNRN